MRPSAARTVPTWWGSAVSKGSRSVGKARMDSPSSSSSNTHTMGSSTLAFVGGSGQAPRPPEDRRGSLRERVRRRPSGRARPHAGRPPRCRRTPRTARSVSCRCTSSVCSTGASGCHAAARSWPLACSAEAKRQATTSTPAGATPPVAPSHPSTCRTSSSQASQRRRAATRSSTGVSMSWGSIPLPPYQWVCPTSGGQPLPAAGCPASSAARTRRSWSAARSRRTPAASPV
jgi:hypothetical protein